MAFSPKLPNALSLLIAIGLATYSIFVAVTSRDQNRADWSAFFDSNQQLAQLAYITSSVIGPIIFLLVAYICLRRQFTLILFPLWILGAVAFSSYLNLVLLAALIWWCIAHRAISESTRKS